mmetsp:Transcript_33701/g.107067  ORF Transcript_33701/g.107067 Transcript_33701/m.107067 type:complete len:239 (-) Transcript_33701:1102-1818(-)
MPSLSRRPMQCKTGISSAQITLLLINSSSGSDVFDGVTPAPPRPRSPPAPCTRSRRPPAGSRTSAGCRSRGPRTASPPARAAPAAGPRGRGSAAARPRRPAGSAAAPRGPRASSWPSAARPRMGPARRRRSGPASPGRRPPSCRAAAPPPRAPPSRPGSRSPCSRGGQGLCRSAPSTCRAARPRGPCRSSRRRRRGTHAGTSRPAAAAPPTCRVRRRCGCPPKARQPGARGWGRRPCC